MRTTVPHVWFPSRKFCPCVSCGHFVKDIILTRFHSQSASCYCCISPDDMEIDLRRALSGENRLGLGLRDAAIAHEGAELGNTLLKKSK